MHRNAELIFKKHARDLFRPGMSVLEVGPDASPSTFQKLAGPGIARWDTLDVAAAHAQPTYLVTDQYNYPVPDSKYDVVISGQVIEHVRKIWRWFPELARMCKPGGLVITINPVSWHF